MPCIPVHLWRHALEKGEKLAIDGGCLSGGVLRFRSCRVAEYRSTRVRSIRMRSAECGMRNIRMRSAECGMRNDGWICVYPFFSVFICVPFFLIPHFAFRIPHSQLVPSETLDPACGDASAFATSIEHSAVKVGVAHLTHVPLDQLVTAAVVLQIKSKAVFAAVARGDRSRR